MMHAPIHQSVSAQAVEGERRLWLTVLLTAVRDAQGSPKSCSVSDHECEIRRARVFLCASHSLSFVAHCAGLDPEPIRAWALQQPWGAQFKRTEIQQ